MSQPQHPGPGEAAPETLLGDLISYYQEEAGAGRLRVCRQAALTHRARRFSDMGPPLQLYLPELVASNLRATHSQGAPSPTQPVCHELVQALEFLELISVNLLLFPWRKEIRSLKTYTGNFAYRVQPVLSEQTLHTILGRLGYVATSEAEFSLVQAISKEDAKQMVFEIFLARVTCEAILGTSSRQVLGLGREKPYRRRSSKRKLAKAHNCPEGAQPGPQEGLGSERALAEGPDHQSTVPTAPSLSEVSTSPRTLRAGPQLPLDSQRHASTRSDSEEFLTCYSDLVLHRTPLFRRDFPLRGLKGDQAQGPAPAPSPPAGEALTSLGSSGEWSLVPSAAPESRVVTIPRQPRLTPGPQLSGKSLDPKPEAQPEPATPDADTVPPNTSSELDELCEHLSHLLGPPTLADHPGGLPGPGVEDTRQSEPLTGPEPAAEAGGPDSRITQLWRPTQNPLMYEGPRHYVPPGELEGPVLTQEHHPGNS
ncbi:spermatogenesis-associated protein 2-like protein [Panthera uncia]|uniref:spermatogenesis-associated protein 2-like protein n=1 Tax=Panthera uncia TaxID=29064 RepID=UPI0020FFE656|nr:spermatogenesis-associated protein 2-like protein [Panthera uncia]